MNKTDAASECARKFQFSLGTLLVAVLYAAGLATAIVAFAGPEWYPRQVVAAYATTIVLIGGFAAASRLRGKIAVYLLISPLVFTVAVIMASMFDYKTSSVSPLVSPQVRKSPVGGATGFPVAP